jgi:hypothetical protein
MCFMSASRSSEPSATGCVADLMVLEEIWSALTASVAKAQLERLREHRVCLLIVVIVQSI